MHFAPFRIVFGAFRIVSDSFGVFFSEHRFGPFFLRFGSFRIILDRVRIVFGSFPTNFSAIFSESSLRVKYISLEASRVEHKPYFEWGLAPVVASKWQVTGGVHNPMTLLVKKN